MGPLIELAARILIGLGKAGGVRSAAIRMSAVAFCVSLAAVLMLTALGCVLASLWIFALPSLGPVGAPLAVAAALAVMTLILAAAAWLILRQGRRRSGATLVPQMLLSEATRLFSEHKGAVLLAAAVAGMAAANGGSRKRAV